MEIAALPSSEASTAEAPPPPRAPRPRREMCEQRSYDWMPCDDRDCVVRTGRTPKERDCSELFAFELDTEREMAFPCILLDKAWTIDGIIKFNAGVQLESPEIKEAYEAYKAAALDEARAIRELYAKIQDGDDFHRPAARRRLLKAIRAEDAALRRFGYTCLH